MTTKDEKPTPGHSGSPDHAQDDETDQEKPDAIALPSHVVGSGTLDRLIETARDYAKQAASENTLEAYAKDWAHFARWSRLKGIEPLPPSPEMIGLYLADLAAPANGSPSMVAAFDARCF